MSSEMKAAFKGAKLIDFTSSTPKGGEAAFGFQHMERFDQEFIDLVRKNKGSCKGVVVVDRGIGAGHSTPVIAKDHINISGSNPLVGPNDPNIGERFPIVQGVYLAECWDGANTVVVAGLKDGVKPNEEEQKLLKTIGADISSYNLVPSMLVAAHAGLKVLGIILPEGSKLDETQLKEIKALTGGSN